MKYFNFVMQSISPSKHDLKEDLSLAHFMVTEKEVEMEDLQMQLEEAKNIIRTLESMHIYTLSESSSNYSHQPISPPPPDYLTNSPPVKPFSASFELL